MGKLRRSIRRPTEAVSGSCSCFPLRSAREFRAVENPEPELRQELEESLERTRQIVREALVEWGVIDSELSKFAVMNAEGLDATIASLCAPLDPPA